MTYPCEIGEVGIKSSTLVPLDAYSVFGGELDMVIRQCLTEPVCCSVKVVNEYTGRVVVPPFFADTVAEGQAEAIKKVMALYDAKKSTGDE